MSVNVVASSLYHCDKKTSHRMSLIGSKDNKTTELKFAALLRKHHVTGWRRRRPLIGSPDFVFPIQRVAIFVDGCFWHGCVRCSRIPKVNRRFWSEKFAQNRRRDYEVTKILRKMGWRVLRIWEHDLREKPLRVLSIVNRTLSGSVVK